LRAGEPTRRHDGAPGQTAAKGNYGASEKSWTNLFQEKQTPKAYRNFGIKASTIFCAIQPGVRLIFVGHRMTRMDANIQWL